MISETSKYLSKLHHLMLNERERDDATLPLDLWKSNVRKLAVYLHQRPLDSNSESTSL